MIRKLIMATLFSIVALQIHAQSELKEFFTSTQSFFNTHVKEGKVAYSEIKERPKALEELVSQIASVDPFSLKPNKQKAFLVNAYNLFVIYGASKAYPISSVQTVPGFFTQTKYTIGGKQYSLDQIEKELLDPKNDPRIHFVLVCGAKGCPPIATKIPMPENVEQFFEEHVKNLMNDNSYVILKPELNLLEVSEIFDWYQNDFGGNADKVFEFINQYQTEKVPNDYKLKYYTFDWALNEQSLEASSQPLSNLLAFTPSALFSYGQYEIGVLNNYYVQNTLIDENGKTVSLGQSQAFLSSTIQFTFGVNKKANVNFGIDARITTARYGEVDDTSPFDFLNQSGVSFQRTLLSALGPRIKVAPFKSIPRLSLQTSFLFPMSNLLEKQQFIDHDRYTWLTQFLYDRKLSSDFQLFSQIDFMYRINRNSFPERNFLRVPISIFINYFPNQNMTLFMFSQYAPRFENVQMSSSEEFGLSQWFTQLGGGVKYQLIQQLGLELSYGNVIASRVDGNGYLINFGLRYIHR